MPKMVVTLVITTNYNEQLTMNCYSKQTQSNPTCPERSRRICSELARPERGRRVEPTSSSIVICAKDASRLSVISNIS